MPRARCASAGTPAKRRTALDPEADADRAAAGRRQRGARSGAPAGRGRAAGHRCRSRGAHRRRHACAGSAGRGPLQRPWSTRADVSTCRPPTTSTRAAAALPWSGRPTSSWRSNSPTCGARSIRSSTVRQGTRTSRLKPGAKVINLGVGDLYIRANYQDFQRFAEADISIGADAEATLPASDRGGEIRADRRTARGQRQAR